MDGPVGQGLEVVCSGGRYWLLLPSQWGPGGSNILVGLEGRLDPFFWVEAVGGGLQGGAGPWSVGTVPSEAGICPQPVHAAWLEGEVCMKGGQTVCWGVLGGAPVAQPRGWALSCRGRASV